MLRKFFQNGVYSFRENWEKNLRVFHTAPCFNPQLFKISLKLEVLFQCRSEITWPTVYGCVTWFPFVWWGKVSGLIPRRRTYPWLVHFSSISAAICLLLKIFCQDNKFFILKSVSLFPTSRSSWSISELLLL